MKIKYGEVVTDEGQKAVFDPQMQYSKDHVVWLGNGYEMLLVCVASFEAIAVTKGSELDVRVNSRVNPYNEGRITASLTSEDGRRQEWEWPTYVGEDVTGYCYLQAGPVDLSGDRPEQFLRPVMEGIVIPPFWMGVAVALEKLREQELLLEAGIEVERRVDRNQLPLGKAVGCVAVEGCAWKDRVIDGVQPHHVFTPGSFYRVD